MKLATLRPEERVGLELEAHLGECAVCRRVLETDRQVWRMLELYETPQLTAGFFAGVEQRLAARDKVRTRLRLADRFANFHPALRFAAAAVVVVVLGTVAGGWLGVVSTASKRAAGGPAAVASTDQAYAQFFDVAPPGSMTRAYLSLDPGENSR